MWATIIQMFMKKSSAVNAQLWADIYGSFYTASTLQSDFGEHKNNFCRSF